MTRPSNIKHYSELQGDDNSHYEGSDELLGITAKFGRNMGLTRIGVNHDLLPLVVVSLGPMPRAISKSLSMSLKVIMYNGATDD